MNIVARCQILGLFNAASFDDTYMFLLVMVSLVSVLVLKALECVQVPLCCSYSICPFFDQL